MTQREFHEVFRDPSSICEDPEGQVWIQNLQPDTLYGFRIRAFNDFGPGPYVHKYFSTLPSAPQTPVLVKAGPTELHLRWLFNNCHKNWLQELKGIFEGLEYDASGSIFREDVSPFLLSSSCIFFCGTSFIHVLSFFTASRRFSIKPWASAQIFENQICSRSITAVNNFSPYRV